MVGISLKTLVTSGDGDGSYGSKKNWETDCLIIDNLINYKFSC